MDYLKEIVSLKMQNKKLVELVEHQIERLTKQAKEMKAIASKIEEMNYKVILEDKKKCNFFKWLFK